MQLENGITALINLGFTRLEAEIYTFLIQNSPATGYKIAQAINKPAANVYKAIQSLESKGAVLVDDSETRLCRSVNPDELLDRLQRTFNNTKNTAEHILSSLAVNDHDNRVYQIRSLEQLIQRCRTMLQNSKEIVVIDAFPGALSLISKDIEEAAKRGINIAVNIYGPTDIKGVRIYDRSDGSTIINRWPGQWLNMIMDGEEYLISFINNDLDKVIQAVWSGSPYLSWVYYSSLMAEFQLSAIKKMIKCGSSAAELQALLEKDEQFFLLEASGYHKLLKEFNK